MTVVAYPHIEITSDGVPLVAGTKTKVAQVMSADEMKNRIEFLPLR